MTKNKLYSMKEVCEMTSLTYDTLKFYCNKGLIPNVKRNQSNYRVFDDNDINWIKNLSCLKKCGMSIIEMQKYASLCLQGETSIPERQRILNAKLKDLNSKREEIDSSIAYVKKKQKFYDCVLKGTTEYYSYLIPKENDGN